MSDRLPTDRPTAAGKYFPSTCSTRLRRAMKALGVPPERLRDCVTLAEVKALAKTYFRIKAQRLHPDHYRSAQRRAIRLTQSMHAQGHSCSEIALAVGYSKSMVRRWLLGRIPSEDIQGTTFQRIQKTYQWICSLDSLPVYRKPLWEEDGDIDLPWAMERHNAWLGDGWQYW